MKPPHLTASQAVISMKQMNTDKKNIPGMAQEILTLEKKKMSGQLSDEEMERWAELAFALFEQSDSSKRKSFRMPAGHQAQAEFGSTKQDVMIVEVSMLGLSVVGDNFKNIALGNQIFLLFQPLLKKSAQPLRLAFSVASVHTKMDGTHGSIGLQLQKDSPEQERQDYYNLIYFPAYLGYLESLAAG